MVSVRGRFEWQRCSIAQFARDYSIHGGRGWVKLIKPPVPVPIFCCMAGGNGLRMDSSFLEMGLDWEWKGAEKFRFHWNRTHAFFSKWNWPPWFKLLWMYSWSGENDFEKKSVFNKRLQELIGWNRIILSFIYVFIHWTNT